MRKFFGVDGEKVRPDSDVSGCSVDAHSTVCDSAVRAGSIAQSVLCNVHAKEVSASGAVLVNVTARKITVGKNCLVYGVMDDSEEGIVLADGDVSRHWHRD